MSALELSKSEVEIAAAMDLFHWRKWLTTQTVADRMHRSAGHLKNSLLAMTKRKIVSRKGVGGDEMCFRLTPVGRLALRTA